MRGSFLSRYPCAALFAIVTGCSTPIASSEQIVGRYMLTVFNGYSETSPKFKFMTLDLGADHSYVQRYTTELAITGTWEMRGDSITIRAVGDGSAQRGTFIPPNTIHMVGDATHDDLVFKKE